MKKKEQNYTEKDIEEELSKFRIYLASALFTSAEREWNEKLAQALTKEGFRVILPQDECEGMESAYDIFSKCTDSIDNCNLVLANLEGTDVDSGTAFECGYAFGKGIPVIGIRTDFRQRGDDGGLNCMLSKCLEEDVITAPTINLIIKKFIKILSEVEYYNGSIAYSKIPEHIKK